MVSWLILTKKYLKEQTKKAQTIEPPSPILSIIYTIKIHKFNDLKGTQNQVFGFKKNTGDNEFHTDKKFDTQKMK